MRADSQTRSSKTSLDFSRAVLARYATIYKLAYMKLPGISLFTGLCLLALALPAARAQTVPLVFQTTFNCPDWDQTMGLSDSAVCSNGDGIAGSGSWTSSNGSVDQITIAANNPAGGGGKGFRHWVGDGLNNGGGGIRVEWAPIREMWLRYYIRFQTGFAWGNSINMKTIYVNQNTSQGGTFYFGLHQGFIGGHVTVDQTNGGNKHSNVTWSQMQGGSLGDGQFHCLEVHTKMNSVPGAADGIMEFWFDGTPIYRDSITHFSDVTNAGFIQTFVGSNHNDPQNSGQDAYVDFCDIAVSANGRVGCLGSVVLAAPRNLRVQ